MCRKLRVNQKDLAITGWPFSADRAIPLANIQSVEVYGKSIVPPIVTAIFLLAGQTVLLTLINNITPVAHILFSNQLVLLSVNALVVLCVLLALFRVRCVTLQVTLQKKKPLVLHFVSRAAGENIVEYVQHAMKEQEKVVAMTD